MWCAWKFSKNPRHCYFVGKSPAKKVQKSEFFQLCSYPTALAEITDIIMKASEKVDHFVGKNQCNQALVCAMRWLLSFQPQNEGFKLWFHSSREWERKKTATEEKWKFQRHLERMSLITNLHWIIKHNLCQKYSSSYSWFSSHENDNHNLDYR